MRVSVADFCYKIVSSTQCRHGPHRAPHTPPTTWTESSACCVNMEGLKGWVRTWLVIATRARLACRCRQPNVELLSPRNGTSSWRHGASLAGSHGRIVYSTRMDPLVVLLSRLVEYSPSIGHKLHKDQNMPIRPILGEYSKSFAGNTHQRTHTPELH